MTDEHDLRENARRDMDDHDYDEMGMALDAAAEDGIAGVEEEVLEGSDLVVCPKCYLHPANRIEGLLPHGALPHPWRAEVSVPGESHWAGNNLTFVTKEDAEAYGLDLMSRWMSVREYRVVDESTPKKEPLS